MKAIKLTWSKVRRACVKAMKENRLQCQKKTFSNGTECAYYDRGRVCAIGSALTKEQLALVKKLELNTGTDVYTLIDELQIDATDADKMSEMQSAHDRGLDALKEFLKANPEKTK